MKIRIETEFYVKRENLCSPHTHTHRISDEKCAEKKIPKETSYLVWFYGIAYVDGFSRVWKLSKEQEKKIIKKKK